jgi:hypothetical protein
MDVDHKKINITENDSNFSPLDLTGRSVTNQEVKISVQDFVQDF